MRIHMYIRVNTNTIASNQAFLNVLPYIHTNTHTHTQRYANTCIYGLYTGYIHNTIWGGYD